jgi:hypothetical protein
MILKTLTLLYIYSFINGINSDVYLHNPRGSNNRCDELSNNRRNANRLFDSQNNAAGGYAVTCNRPENAKNDADINCYQMNYYKDTVIPIRWTSQHNCGNNNDCQFILQYSCENILGKNIRDGHPQNINGNTCTNTIPEKTDRQLEEEERINYLMYGKHEEYAYYQRCKDRERNPFLFTADQKLKGGTSQYTRQNPNGNRYGFECPEERDYYPYWGESDWIDIAILTTDTSRCDYYLKNSRCYTEKHDCVGGSKFSSNKESCEENGGVWYTYSKFSEILCNVTCIDAPTSTINRLGIGVDSKKHTEFNWKLPNVNLNNCVLRIRYNISTNETPWNFNNTDNFKLKNNPIMNTSEGVPVRMAVNTAQYGRTFEDRTYTFNIINRPDELVDKTIHNINVQGKRGNIAQVRNCIEYDFVPNNLSISVNDYIHFQFIGSDYNPLNNDGEGRAGTDRSNLVMISDNKDNIPSMNTNNLFESDVLLILASLGQDINDPNKCFSFLELDKNNQRNNQQSLKNCALLNRAEPYFNMKPVKVSKTGKIKMMSSRNNNFSNRGQKLYIYAMNNTSYDSMFLAAKQENNNSKNNNYIIGAVAGSLLGCLIIVIVIYNRKKIPSIKDLKKKVKINTSSYV